MGVLQPWEVHSAHRGLDMPRSWKFGVLVVEGVCWIGESSGSGLLFGGFMGCFWFDGGVVTFASFFFFPCNILAVLLSNLQFRRLLKDEI